MFGLSTARTGTEMALLKRDDPAGNETRPETKTLYKDGRAEYKYPYHRNTKLFGNLYSNRGNASASHCILSRALGLSYHAEAGRKPRRPYIGTTLSSSLSLFYKDMGQIKHKLILAGSILYFLPVATLDKRPTFLGASPECGKNHM